MYSIRHRSAKVLCAFVRTAVGSSCLSVVHAKIVSADASWEPTGRSGSLTPAAAASARAQLGRPQLGIVAADSYQRIL